MTRNTRLLLAAIAIVAVGALMFKGLVSPARDRAATAQAAQRAAEGQAGLNTGQLTDARQAADRAPANARLLRRLGVAVPEKVEAAAMIDQLDTTAKRRHVSFDVLKITDATANATPAPAPTKSGIAGGVGRSSDVQSGSTTPAPATTTPAPAAATPATAAGGSTAASSGSAPAGSVPVNLTVQVSGKYTAVTQFVRSLQGAVRANGRGLTATGRLLRVGAVDLDVGDGSSGRSLSGTLSVVAYLLPPVAGDGAAAAPATGAQP